MMYYYDYDYMVDMIKKAKSGSSNALAELFAATYVFEFSYAQSTLRDYELSKIALSHTYKEAFLNIKKLPSADLLLAWLHRFTFQSCLNIMSECDGTDKLVHIGSNAIPLSRVLNLPLLESQLLIMRYFQKMSIRQIEKSLNVSRSTISKSVSLGRRHLNQTSVNR